MRPELVVMVEDHPIHAELAELQIRRVWPEATVRWIKVGREAVDLFSDPAPALPGWPDRSVVLLDTQLPGITGFELLAMIRDNPSVAHVPVIYVTASSAVALEEIDAPPADAFLPKPLRAAELAAAAEELGLDV